jgi:hypothetical protein
VEVPGTIDAHAHIHLLLGKSEHHSASISIPLVWKACVTVRPTGDSLATGGSAATLDSGTMLVIEVLPAPKSRRFFCGTS